MKKFTTTVILTVVLITLATPIIMPVTEAQADYLPPDSCVAAQELGWKIWGWNERCFIALSLNCCDPMGDPWY